MLLLTYSFNNPQNFSILQDFLTANFQSSFQKRCYNFKEEGRSETEVSFLFLENEVKIFYCIPRCMEFDSFTMEKSIHLQNFLLKVYDVFDGNIDISAHLSYNDISCPKDYIFHYLPEEYKCDDREIIDYFKETANAVSCSLYTSPQASQEILFVVNSYDMNISSISNVIDGKNKSDFIPRFFSLVTLLSNRR